MKGRGRATPTTAAVAVGAWLLAVAWLLLAVAAAVARVLSNKRQHGIQHGVQMVRRARGYAPQPLALALSAAHPVLACGAHQKNTFCLLHERQALLSHHIGDLENLETLTAYEHAIAHYRHLFDITPAVVAHDMHPDYLATGYALRQPLPRIAVQHHHTHIASVMAEHHLAQHVIGIAADGTGYGDDGALWGGEVLVCDLRAYTRAAHLAYVPLPGGEHAVREPWRMAAVYLQQAYGDDWHTLDIPFTRAIDPARWRTLAQMIARGINSPPTSSMGRLFDTVAALLGIRHTVRYEGQATIELEQVATPDGRSYPFALTTTAPGTTQKTCAPCGRHSSPTCRQAYPLPPSVAHSIPRWRCSSRRCAATSHSSTASPPSR